MVNLGLFAQMNNNNTTMAKFGLDDFQGAYLVCTKVGCTGEDEDQDPKGLRLGLVRSERDAAILAAHAMKADGQALSALQRECVKRAEPGTIKILYQFSMYNAKAACGWDNQAVKKCWTSKKKIDEFSTEEVSAGGGDEPGAGGDRMWDGVVANSPDFKELKRAVTGGRL